MGTFIYRVTGIALSLTVAVLGAVASILLYYGGQDGIDVFFKDSTYMDEHHRIHKRMPTDDWYGELLLKGWAFGFVYVVPGLIGATASLFFEKCIMILHVVVAVVFLIAGSFLHTAGTMAIILFRVFTVNGVIRYDSWPSDCIYVRYNDGLQQDVADEKCESGRKALNYAIAAASVTLVAWVFLLCELLYVGFTYHNIGKKNTKTVKETVRPEEERPRRRTYPQRKRAPPPPRASRPEAETTSGPSTSYDNVVQDTPTAQTTPTFGTFQKSENIGATSSSQCYDNATFDIADEGNVNDTKADIVSDKPVSPEMVEIQEGEKTAL